MKCLGQMDVSILDRNWRVVFCNEQQYKLYAPAGSRAVTNTKIRHLFVNCDAVFGDNDPVITHELVHIYFAEMMGPDLNIKKPKKFEEFFACLFEHRGLDMLALSIPITKAMYKHRKAANAK